MAQKPLRTPIEILEHLLEQKGECQYITCGGRQVGNKLNTCNCPLARWNAETKEWMVCGMVLYSDTVKKAEEKREEIRKFKWLEELK